ncbi:MAG: type II toxin-antitoxin system RelE/ParE family toxin, partial [Candidatus Omnitrophica bacterium]|nr:type II toxin-antitoxin system RelE/ParE family toxin [Candidatus Omnitrophota bacterium]
IEYIRDALENVLAHDPMAGKPLKGTYKGLRSYRLGVIRILYWFHNKKLVVVIVDIVHRKDVYR